MKKKIIITIIILLALLALAAFVAYRIKTVKNSTNQAENLDKGFVFFYGETCPHCIKVEQFMADNKIEEKMVIVKKEALKNEKNSLLLLKVNKKCGLDTRYLSVPVLWDGDNGKCYSGDVDIINFFKNKFNRQ